MGKLPYIPFYFKEWLSDKSLRCCSHAARGVWIDMLCLAFDCDERGVFITAGGVWSLDKIARAVGGNLDVTLPCIQELLDNDVAKRREDGAIYSKFIVELESERKRKNQKQGRYREKKPEGLVEMLSTADEVDTSMLPPHLPPVGIQRRKDIDTTNPWKEFSDEAFVFARELEDRHNRLKVRSTIPAIDAALKALGKEWLGKCVERYLSTTGSISANGLKGWVEKKTGEGLAAQNRFENEPLSKLAQAQQKLADREKRLGETG